MDNSNENKKWVATLKIEIILHKEEVEEGDYEDFKAFITPNPIGDYLLTLDIDIKTGTINHWNQTGGHIGTFFYKAVDTGIYTLLDNEGTVLARFTGYVPNKLIPDKDGFGDYITLNINTLGEITNWYQDYSFVEFYDEFGNLLMED
jgi:hypothetical protein